MTVPKHCQSLVAFFEAGAGRSITALATRRVIWALVKDHQMGVTLNGTLKHASKRLIRLTLIAFGGTRNATDTTDAQSGNLDNGPIEDPYIVW